VDTKQILSHGFDAYAYEQILVSGAVAGHMPVTRSRSGDVAYIFADGLRIPLNDAEKEKISIKINAPQTMPAPITAGDSMGSATVYIDENFYTEVALVAVGSATRHDYKTSLEKVLNVYFGQITTQSVKIVLPER
jgi:D-alanyl-D-alanine carboxypeptidase